MLRLPLLLPACLLQVGYKKEKLDPATYAFLMDWYHDEMESVSPKVESWPPENTYVNHWKIDTTMSHSPRRVQKVRGRESDRCEPEVDATHKTRAAICWPRYCCGVFGHAVFDIDDAGSGWWPPNCTYGERTGLPF